MPMLKQTDYELIGVAVEPTLKDFWTLKREPDRFGLPRAIASMQGSLELVHYDSDKSYHGRKWSQEIIWKSLKKGGIFISDDIEVRSREERSDELPTLYLSKLSGCADSLNTQAA